MMSEQRTASDAVDQSLSDRQVQVLRLISEGRSAKEIACELNISAKTAESHRRAVMEKLNLYTIAQLTKEAIRRGLTQI